MTPEPREGVTEHADKHCCLGYKIEPARPVTVLSGGGKSIRCDSVVCKDKPSSPVCEMCFEALLILQRKLLSFQT